MVVVAVAEELEEVKQIMEQTMKCPLTILRGEVEVRTNKAVEEAAAEMVTISHRNLQLPDLNRRPGLQHRNRTSKNLPQAQRRNDPLHPHRPARKKASTQFQMTALVSTGSNL